MGNCKRHGSQTANNLNKMSEAKLDETSYEFAKENEAKQACDDIDDFEARLRNGGAKRQQPPALRKPLPTRKPQQPSRPTGAQYVADSKAQRRPSRPSAADDDVDDFDAHAKKAVSDLDKFDACAHGDILGDDDD